MTIILRSVPFSAFLVLAASLDLEALLVCQLGHHSAPQSLDTTQCS